MRLSPPVRRSLGRSYWGDTSLKRKRRTTSFLVATVSFACALGWCRELLLPAHRIQMRERPHIHLPPGDRGGGAAVFFQVVTAEHLELVGRGEADDVAGV